MERKSFWRSPQGIVAIVIIALAGILGICVGGCIVLGAIGSMA